MRPYALAGLFLLAACSSSTDENPPVDPGVETGVVRLITGTAGIGTDTNGYTLGVHDSVFAVGAFDTNYVVSVADTTIGVVLNGIDGPCRIHDFRLKNVAVVANDTVTIQWQVDCGIITAYGNDPIFGPAFIDFEVVTGRTTGNYAYNMNVATWDFSPDGRRIAASVFTGGIDSKLYLLGLATPESTLVATGATRNEYPTWSPDGQQIRFMSGSDSTGFQMLSVGPGGVGATPVAGFPGYRWWLRWSRQGDRFAYVTGAMTHLVVANADGSAPDTLVIGPYSWVAEPVWSPSGDSLVYNAPILLDPTTTTLPLFIVRTDGSPPVQLTHPAPWDLDYSPTWSKDGRYIAYIHQTGNEMNTKKIIILDLIGGGDQEIPYPPGMSSIRWRP